MLELRALYSQRLELHSCLQFLSRAGMIIVATETLRVFLLRALCASVFSRLERQASLPFE